MTNMIERIQKYVGDIDISFVADLTGQGNEIILRDDGDGIYIEKWDVEEINKPTCEQLALIEVIEDTENIVENNG